MNMALLKYCRIKKRHSGLPIKSKLLKYCGHCITISRISFFSLTKKLLSNYRCPIILVHMISANRTIGFEFFCHPVYAILSARVKIFIVIFAHILNRRLWANRESFPYKMNIVDGPRKFPLECFIVYGTYMRVRTCAYIYIPC